MLVGNDMGPSQESTCGVATTLPEPEPEQSLWLQSSTRRLPPPGLSELDLLQTVVRLSARRPYKFMYNHEWLAITRTYGLDQLIIFGVRNAEVPHVRPLDEENLLIDKPAVWIDENPTTSSSRALSLLDMSQSLR